ncbi:hypothetical protein HNV10_03015 [Winogradskyella litoriviva]|uniref:Gliding motility protein GldL-like N-terminal domain-containing protein n=1 Tax=Winogradskyella litoriviva TaxID=1220182 RepID=A0ABX2E1N6_9FLAO|nr:hypothetical protein [Winogradskyella litoriviva]NRD22195.1 hypothetical protein [Winogradskyella litoriviva]
MPNKILTFPLRLSLIILIFGALFKIMHWPYATQLMLIGEVLIGILYSIRFIKKVDKSKLDYVKLSLILIWVFSYLIKAFHLFYIPFLFEILLVILFIYWFFVEGIDYFRNRKYRSNKFIKGIYYVFIVVTFLTLGCGIIFKIQHWPYGAILFTLGVLQLSMLLIFDYFIIDRSQKNRIDIR